MQRSDGRRYDELRPLRIVYNIYEHAAGSVLYELGKTKVLCAVTIHQGLPLFLRGSKTGWLTAQYAMLPPSTPKRTEREIQLGKQNGRYVEISRLIGRSLRSVLKLELLADKTITIDCDVLQADGSTRTACITAAYLALKQAEQRWLSNGVLESPCITHEIAAVSIGIVQGNPVLDPHALEDNIAGADFNFVITRSGDLIEVQGTAEKEPLAPGMLQKMHALATHGVQNIFSSLETTLQPKKKPGLFTLAERLKQVGYSESV